MRDDHSIIDADRHVLEPVEVWQSYLPNELRSRAPSFAPVPVTEPAAERPVPVQRAR